MRKRVVVTGMGVAAPNAHGLDDFEKRCAKAGQAYAFSRCWKN